jgi:hypothetical protein
MNAKYDVLADTPNDEGCRVKIRKCSLLAFTNARECPTAGADEKQCLATYVNVGGCEAWALWDFGSTTTGITPAFTQVTKIPVFSPI